MQQKLVCPLGSPHLAGRSIQICGIPQPCLFPAHMPVTRFWPPMVAQVMYFQLGVPQGEEPSAVQEANKSSGTLQTGGSGGNRDDRKHEEDERTPGRSVKCG